MMSKINSEEKSKSIPDLKEKVKPRTDSKEKVKSKAGPEERSKSKSESSGMAEPIDPFKDNNRLKILKRIISHTCLLITVFAVQYCVLGICASVWYVSKTHLFIFGMICIMHLIGAPLGYCAVKMGNRIFFVILMILNLIWIISAVILLLVYWLFMDSKQFNEEIALHVGSVFYISASIVLALTSFLMMKQLDMISIQYSKPTVKISTEGKASKKR